MIEKILPQEQIEKSKHRELSRLRNQPRKNFKTFIPQSTIFEKVEFQNNNFNFKAKNSYTSKSF